MPKSSASVPYGDQPAFPGGVAVEWYDTGETKRTASGLTVRDWLAAQAIIGILIRPNALPAPFDTEANFAHLAYDMADAMLVARESRNAAPSTPSS